ncbi:Predicted Zn-dependent peptidase [Gracilibacillus orientalis]|uniref:Predicted Zn-dependent peptidase n=1 Tax=Gracilibacillus orientalis TaxID=334253 RepID=A0A1I4PUC1_9BACI|nr:pitrilysin family protein [Gracilibacillus orientalis]SFM31399.1 Predicted Zn-dependent peptidase [Gracilibacillus orientalis]
MLHRKECSNGMRIVLEEVTSVRSVTIGIWVKTGSREEDPELNGISHFIEHMLFKGTEKRTPQEIAEAFDGIGGEINAFTSKEYTCFYAKVLDTHKELAIEILADMLLHSTFDQTEIEREKKVVLEEINMTEDTPDDIIHDLLAEAAYQQHPIAKPILGSKSTINQMSKQDMLHYLQNQYIPENIVVSIAGNANHNFINTVEETLTVQRNETLSDRKYLSKPTFHPKQISQTKETEQAHLCLGYEGVRIEDELEYAMLIVNNVLGGSMSSRLFQEIREKTGMAYSIFSYHSAFIDSGMLTIYAGTAKNQLYIVQDKIHHIVDQLRKNGLTTKEWENSKEQLKGLYMLSLESTNSKMGRNARNELLSQGHPSLDDIMKKIDDVKLDDVQYILDTLQSDSVATAIISPE